jgi:precorrin-2 dehydrogenase/sirohydrochlorin ferrochelatase
VIPLVQDFAAETVLVFGGGAVGARKARRFASEARVVVLSRAFADADFGGAERVREAVDATGASEWIRRTDPGLVVAATDDATLNAAIERAARERGRLINRTDRAGDERGPGGVAVPATVREGPVTLAVSTAGASPALAAELRDRIAGEIAGAGAVAEAVADLRAEMIADGVDRETRREAIRAAVGADRVWKALDTPGDNVSEIAGDVIETVTGDSA